MPGIAAAPVVSTPNEQPTYEAITLNGTPVGLAGVGDTYAPTKIPSPGEQYNPLGGNKQRSGGTSLADLFTPHEPSWAEQLGEANPLLMTGLAMLGANAANNPYDGWAQMANAAGGALSEYEKLRQGREALRTQRQGAIADAANATTRNAIERERNQVLQAQKQQELLAEANDPMRYIEMQKAQMDMAKTRADIQRINAALQARQMTQAEAQAVQTLLDTAAKQGVDYSLEDALAIVRGGMGASLPGSMGITSTNVQE
jgi:hypothetical protein